jgi:hypothetical protein
MPTDDLVRLVRSIQQTQAAAYVNFAMKFNELKTELPDIDRRLARLARNLPIKKAEAELAQGALITTGPPRADDTDEAAPLCAQGEHFERLRAELGIAVSDEIVADVAAERPENQHV